MSLNDAHAFAFSLATTLMAVIAIFRAGDGTLSVSPANEYDGEPSAIVGEIDPFAPYRGECEGETLGLASRLTARLDESSKIPRSRRC